MGRRAILRLAQPLSPVEYDLRPDGRKPHRFRSDSLHLHPLLPSPSARNGGKHGLTPANRFLADIRSYPNRTPTGWSFAWRTRTDSQRSFRDRHQPPQPRYRDRQPVIAHALPAVSVLIRQFSFIGLNDGFQYWIDFIGPAAPVVHAVVTGIRLKMMMLHMRSQTGTQVMGG